MQPVLFWGCRDSVPEAVANYYGILGHHICPAKGGCYLPNLHPEVYEMLSAIESLEFPNLENWVPIGQIPELIRTVPGDYTLPFRISALGSTVATKYTEIGGLRSRTIDNNKIKCWRSARRISQETRVLLLEESKDRMLEALSPATFNPMFFPSLAGIGNVVLVSPGYSVYDDGSMCEWLQLLNMTRSIHFAYMANQYGLPCVPCIGWNRFRSRDLERLAEWLIRQGEKVTHLAVNAQTGGEQLWSPLADGMYYLESKTRMQYHWVVFGGTNSLHVISSKLPSSRISLVSSAVPTYTLKHRPIGQKATVDIPQELLVMKNIELERQRREIALTGAECNIGAGYLQRCS